MLKNIFKLGFWSYILLLTVALLVPVPDAGPANEFDKVVHASIFGLAGILMILAYGPDKRHFFCIIIYGIAIECAQGLTGYRSFEFLDLLANICGLLTSRIILAFKQTAEA